MRKKQRIHEIKLALKWMRRIHEHSCIVEYTHHFNIIKNALDEGLITSKDLRGGNGNGIYL
jgi:hypothetical protein